jgi:hypothetical protein
MSTIEIREKLHQYIDQADDKKVKAFYTIVEEEIQPHSIWNDNGFVKELERRVTEIENGTVKGYTWQEVQSNAKQALKKAKHK